MSLLLIIILAAIAGYAVSVYNSLATKSVQIKEARANIETLLKKRFDLIPNLVNTVKGYAKHEKDLFTKVTELRSSIGKATSMEELAELDKEMNSAVKGILAVAENYPELKANSNFLDLQEKLTNIETELQKSRKFYNAIVGEYNEAIVKFPATLLANMYGFKPAEFFKASEEEKENVEVKF